MSVTNCDIMCISCQTPDESVITAYFGQVVPSISELLCHFKNSKGRYIECNEYEDYIEENIERVRLNKSLYRQRQSIVEHPFGTMKRQWGFDHIMTKKSIKHATADVGFIFIAYNLKRIINSIGINQLIKHIILFWLKIPVANFLILRNKALEQTKKFTAYFIEYQIHKSKTIEIAYF